MGLPNAVIFGKGTWQGFLMDEGKCLEIKSLIESQAEWRPRDEAEKDKEWQQIYPYALFRCGDLYAEFSEG